MNVQHLARAGYAAPAAPTRTARGVEYDAFVHVTRKLNEAAETAADAEMPKHARIRRLAEALDANRRLWATLAADLASDENALPEALRARLLSLCEFARIHSSRVLDGRASAELLIELNTAMMRGLRGDAGRAPVP